ncbi:hypothetical protein Celaphus_00007759 [Cervus elaphus hippelaphus]|uniref:Uncharacterized protein n=1 Tax=Cervus elaphus hippelaphus TaxID=46360 RepID=A0A212CAH3_CEREH|nr:hypothetical protein Celaphus_00007759 [Cervus elaphus hippelaphus]
MAALALGPPPDMGAAWPPGGHPGLSDHLWDAAPSPASSLPPTGDRPKPQLREGASEPPSPLLLPSLGARKAVTEKPLGGHEETEDDHAGAGPQERGVWGQGRLSSLGPGSPRAGG